MKTITVYEASIERFINSLEQLKVMLNKANAHAEARKFDVNNYFGMRLSPDMFTFARQIQIACDTAKGCAARLAGKEAPSFPDDEKTLGEFQARIDKTLSFLRTIKPTDFENYETKKVSFPWYPGKHLMGHDYLLQHAIPNFYFHMTTAYAILRTNGVELGKGDYLGKQNWIAG